MLTTIITHAIVAALAFGGGYWVKAVGAKKALAEVQQAASTVEGAAKKL